MRIFGISLILMAFLISAAGAASFDTDRLLLYWPCDDGSGKTVKDDSGNGFDGEVMGGGAKWVNGVYGGGIELTKTYVEANGDLVANIDNELSFGCWFYLTNHSTYNGIISIISDAEGDCCDYRLMVNPEKAPFWNAGHHTDLNLAGKVAFELEKWYHYVLVLDGHADTVYVDGQMVGEVVEDFAPPPFADVHFWLGTGEGPATWLIEQCSFDDVFVVDKALSEDEVNIIMDGDFTAVAAAGKLAATWAEVKK